MIQRTLDEYLGIRTGEQRERLVSFRDMVPSIPSTTYATHGIYYYPAKFIPQVVRWALEKFTKPGDWAIDPFAGSGTLCVEAVITRRNAVCLDLNPVIEHIVKAKTYIPGSWDELQEHGEAVVNSSEEYKPRWSRISYWYPEEILRILKRMWGGYYKKPHPHTLIALFAVSRKFSYADDTVPKVFKSKVKKEFIEELLKRDYKKEIIEYFWEYLRKIYDATKEFKKYYKGGEIIVKGGIDLIKDDLDKILGSLEFDLLVTSPPYGMAHEYIRSFKLELAWLGYKDKEITELIKKEIPYNVPPNINVNSQTYTGHRRLIRPDLLKYYDTYFKSVIYALERVLERLKPGGVAAIFVGNATFSGVEVPYYKVFKEHFESKGFKYEGLLIDEIKARRLFKGRKNPSPNGIEREYLLILRKLP